MPADDAQARGVRVVVTDAQGRRLRSGGLERWLARAAPARARGLVSVALVSDARARALNRRYRRLNHATDVLSFPADRGATVPVPGSRRAARFLGDIVIARGVARRQAEALGHGEREEVRVLALHGLLHLLGYDHERDDGQMARLERRLLRKGGLRQGVIER
jgi:probable rRNA maturation factor